jgi:PBS lyase HEAT-like repeat
LKAMLITKLKPVVGIVLAVVLIGGGAFVAAPGKGPGVAVVQAPQKAERPKEPVVVAPVPDGAQVAGDSPPKEKLRYKSKDFSAWMETLRTELDPADQIAAIQAIATFGANGYGNEATAVIFEIVRRQDAMAQRQLGDLKLIDQAENTFSRLGLEALPVLTKELDSKVVNNRRWAVWSLQCVVLGYSTDWYPEGRFTPGSGNPLGLGKQLQEGIGGGQAPRILPGVLNPGWRGHFFTADPKELQTKTIPHFLRAFKDSDRAVSNWALNAIVSTDGSDGAFPPSLTGLEKQDLAKALAPKLKDPDVAISAAVALGWLGSEGKSAVPALITALKGGKNFDEQAYYVYALGRMGPAAKEAAPVLQEMLKGFPSGTHIYHETTDALKKINQ